MASKVRLYVDQPLGDTQSVPLSREQAHYLFAVMRLAPGAVLTLINGRDGAWDATVADSGKRGGTLICQKQTAPLRMPPDVWLLVAPIRKERMSFVVEKATELGARQIMPVQTAYTNNGDRVRLEKLQAQAIEATEQCGGTFVPPVNPVQKLKAILADWPTSRTLYFCDEAAQSPAGFATQTDGPAAILIGPEGGFSPEERAMLTALDSTKTISLGPRILRAETAAVAALALWQQSMGDW